MVKLFLPNTILNDTPADAGPVEQNFAFLQQFINANLINADGSVKMTAQLGLFAADGVDPDDAVRKAYVDALMPIGVIMPYCGQSAPAGKWSLCDGTALPTATYPKLFGVLQYRYGGSGGSFNKPNMQGRFPVGLDPTQPEFKTTGLKGGSFTVPVPLHQHTMAHTHEHPHTHPIPHTHSIDPPATVTGDPTGGHQHTESVRQNSTPGATGSYMTASSVGTTVAAKGGFDTGSPHHHAVNFSAFTSGPSSAANTGAVSEATTGGSSAASTANAGTSGVELQPPFVVFQYIIRTD